MTPASKLTALVAACAAACACAYGALIYYQGQKFIEYSSDLSKQFGPEWKNIKVNITDNGFFSKKFNVEAAAEVADKKEAALFPGVVHFGFNPTSELTYSGNDANEFTTFMKKADPRLVGEYNYRFLPQKFTLTSKDAELKSNDGSLKLGAIQAVLTPQVSNQKDGKLLLEGFNTTVNAKFLSLATPDGNVTVTDPSIKLFADTGKNKTADASLSFANLDYSDRSNQFSLDGANLTVKQASSASEITETIKLNFNNLRIGSGILKTKVDCFNTGVVLHFPPEPIVFDFLAQEYLGMKFCHDFPLFCSPTPVDENKVEEILRNSIFAGKTWASIEPSEIKIGKESLSVSGNLRKNPEDNGLGEIKVNLQTTSDGIGRFALMVLPPNAYTNEGKGKYSAVLTPELSPNGDSILLKSNGRKIL